MTTAAVIPAPHAPITLQQRPLPTIADGEAILETIASEVCGTDVHLWHGKLAGVPYPLVPGHVAVGAISATQGDVRDINGNPLAIGTVCTFLDVVGTCNQCWHCRVAKASTRCPSRKVYGITLGADDGLYGGWSTHIHLRKDAIAIPLPAGLDPEMWIAAGCGLPTALHAVDLADIKIGSSVAILGAGPVGLSACALAAASGAHHVYAIDPVDARRNAAMPMGASHAYDLTELATLRAETGMRGPDIVIEASGNPAAVKLALELVRDAGTVIIVGQYTDNGDIGINPHLDINKKHIRVQGCWGSDYSHFHRGVQAVRDLSDRFNWRNTVSATYRLADTQQALEDVASRKVVKAVIAPAG